MDAAEELVAGQGVPKPPADDRRNTKSEEPCPQMGCRIGAQSSSGEWLVLGAAAVPMSEPMLPFAVMQPSAHDVRDVGPVGEAMPVHRVGVKWEQHRVREQLGDC